jgi:hypothetical protein
MLILGGLGENDKITMPIEIYDTETFEWSSHLYFDKYRHASFILERYVFAHGGFDYSNPLHPTDSLVMFDLTDFCVNYKK